MPTVSHYVCDLCAADSTDQTKYMRVYLTLEPVAYAPHEERRYSAVMCKTCAAEIGVPKKTTADHFRAFMRRIAGMLR